MPQMPHSLPGSDLQAEFDSLRPGESTEQGTTRRTALKAAIGAGYAAATLPIAAQTAINTSAEGLKAGPVKYSVNGFDVPAYAAAPAGKTGLPVVLVVQEIFGVHEYIADTCRRFARAGYYAIAPELYARQGDPRSYTDIPKLMTEVVGKVPDAQVMADLDGALKYAAAHGGDADEAAITGFCWGGRIVWLYAATGKVKAGVAWYGRLVGQPGALTPQQPIDLVAELKAPVLGLHGGKDQGIPLDTVDKMKAALATGSPAARASQFVVYPEAGHAFHADYRPSYVAGPAEDGWKRALAWFRTHGVD
jgi:carboxymethylenebutenolidase